MSNHDPLCICAKDDYRCRNCYDDCACGCPDILRVRPLITAEALNSARDAASNTRGWFTDEYPDSEGEPKPVALIEDVVNRIDGLREEKK